MSQQSIADKAQIIRTETQKYGNTRQRVAEVLDDINETKANKGDVEASIQNEANARAAADTALQNSVNAEATARQNADNTLQGNINAEANARAAADTALQNSINAEATARQNADTAEANARAAADTALQNSINAEATARQNADTAEANARAAADALKVDKTTTTISAPDSVFKYAYIFDGSNNVRRMLAGDLGKNIANSSLTSINGAGMTQGANYTWNAANFYFNLTGIPDVSADSSYTSMLVRNSSGRLAYSDGRIPMLKASELFTDAQIDTWRANMQKSTETYSAGSPQVDAILPPVINGNETFNQFITVVGLNLFVNNSTPSTATLEIRRVKDINGNILSTPDVYTGLNIEVSQNNPTILSTSINFSTMPKGYYKAFVTHNGLTNLTSPEFFVGNAISTVALPSPFWVEQINGSPTSISNTQISSNNTSPTTYKSGILTNASLLQNGFIAEYICEFSGSGSGGGSTGSGTFGIIGSDNVIYGIRITSIFNGARGSTFMPDNSTMNELGTLGLTNKIYVIYKNDIVTVINQTAGKVKSFIDPSFKTTDKKAYYSMTGVGGNYVNSGSMTFNNIKSF